ncbi:MAG: NADH-quinone oxidoreductase subunit NuoK [Verrucomicrobiota bacterium]
MEFVTVITLNHYIALSGILFVLGLAAVMTRRSIIIIYMGLEMMLNAANLALVAFSRFNPDGAMNGTMMVFFIITVAAAEVAVGLALIVALYRKKQEIHADTLSSLKF